VIEFGLSHLAALGRPSGRFHDLGVLHFEALEVPLGIADQVAHMRAGFVGADATTFEGLPSGLEFRGEDGLSDQVVPAELVERRAAHATRCQNF
jgi:hypothetical protein